MLYFKLVSKKYYFRFLSTVEFSGLPLLHQHWIISDILSFKNKKQKYSLCFFPCALLLLTSILVRLNIFIHMSVICISFYVNCLFKVIFYFSIGLFTSSNLDVCAQNPCMHNACLYVALIL